MGIFKRFFQKKDQQNIEQEKGSENKFHKKIDSILQFGETKLEEAKTEYSVIKSKLSNLLETNYQLGLKHIERGNLSEAIFRFKFIKFFWKDCFDAYYQLAYVLILAKKPYQAKKVLNELIIKNPDYIDKATLLLASLEKSESN